jgi:hypothetical protein
MPTSYDITTYTGLTNAIQAFTESDEPTFVANIPTFIQDTERLVNNTVQLPAFRRNVTGTATGDFPYLSLPNDFLATFSVAVMNVDEPLITENYRYLLNKDVNYIREAFPYPGVTGTPQYYALFDQNTFILGPTPDVNYDIELHYFAYPTSIVTAGTTWLSTNYPNVLLYGALVEAYIFQKGEQDIVQMYQSKFQEAMAPLKQLADGKDRQDAYRTVQVRDKVQ